MFPIVIVLPKASALKKLPLLCTALALAGCAAAVSNSGRTITIKRDTYGVPHVYADDVHGLFYGYVVAEDRGGCDDRGGGQLDLRCNR